MSNADQDSGSVNTTVYLAEWSDNGHSIEDTLQAWLDGELRTDAAHTVASHVDSCESCAALLQDVHRIRAINADILSAVDALRQVPAVNMRAHPTGVQLARHSRTGRRFPAAPTTPETGMFVKPPMSVARAATVSTTGATVTHSWRRPSIPRTIVATLVLFGSAAFAMSRYARRHDAGALVAQGDNHATVTVGLRVPTGVSGLDLNSPHFRGIVTGMVTTQSGHGIAGAQVLVPRTAVATTTDSLGRFRLEGVPKQSTSLLVSAIGFGDGTGIFNLVASDSATVTVRLRETVLTLAPMSVGGGTSVNMSGSIQCLRVQRDTAAILSPIFRSLRGFFATPGVYRLDVIGWPQKGQTTNGTFAVRADGTLSGSAVYQNSRIGITLLRDADGWTGTASEQQNLVSRSMHVILKPERSLSPCR